MAHVPEPTPDPFPMTDSRLLRDARGDSAGAAYQAAWRALVEGYREPIARALRRRMQSDADAADEFFSYLFDRQVLARYDRTRGQRFRAFIQVVLRNFVFERRRRNSTAGLGLEGDSEAALDTTSVVVDLDRQDEFEWASHALRVACDRLRAEDPGNAELLFAAFGLGEREPVDRLQLAIARGVTLDAIQGRLTTAKRALRLHLEAEIRGQCTDQLTFQSERRLLLQRLLQARPTFDFLSESDHG